MTRPRETIDRCKLIERLRDVNFDVENEAGVSCTNLTTSAITRPSTRVQNQVLPSKSTATASTGLDIFLR